MANIVTATAGLVRDEIEKVADRLLDPYIICEQLRRHGLHGHVTHAFRKLPLCWLNRVEFRPLNVALFNLRPLFVIVAEKR